MAAMSSMLSRGPSRRQLSSINAQCEALTVGITELRAERRSFLASTEEQRNEAVAMETSLRGLQSTLSAPPQTSPTDQVALGEQSERQGELRCEAQAMQRELIKTQEDKARDRQMIQERLRMTELEADEEEAIGVITRLLQAQADRKLCELNCKTKLTEEEVFQEELLRKSQEDLQERRHEMRTSGECQAYWDEMPFVSSDTSHEEEHAEVTFYHQEVEKLQVELERVQESSKLEAEQHRRHVDQLHLRSRLQQELAQLRTMAMAMTQTEGALNGVLAATGSRTAEHMKELLKKDLRMMQELQETLKDLRMMQELQETLKDRQVRCEKEKRRCHALRRHLDRDEAQEG